MSHATATGRALSTGDRFGLVFMMIAGAALAVGSVVSAVTRIVDVLTAESVQVLAEFVDTPALAPIGVDGADLAVELDTAVLTVTDLPGASLWSIVIQQVLMVATVVIVVTCLLLLSRSVLRDRVFSRTNTRLVTTAGLTGLLGAAAYPFFGNMAANGAFAVLSDRTFDNVLMSVDVGSLLMLAFVAALASTVFMVGDRLQRETEGLV